MRKRLLKNSQFNSCLYLFLVPSLRLGTPLERLCLKKVSSWAKAQSL